jgi:hypothetical protein
MPNCAADDGLFGSDCYFCKNNNVLGTKDDGCLDPKFPNCAADDGLFGTDCYFCKNNNVLGTKDDGCIDPALPNCAADDGAYGETCIPCECFNNAELEEVLPETGTMTVQHNGGSSTFPYFTATL